jgi:hypothetical protein
LKPSRDIEITFTEAPDMGSYNSRYQPESPQGALETFNKRVTDQAVANVERRMTPEERKALKDDMAKYAEERRQYEENLRIALMGTGGLGLYKPSPSKPASLQKYEQAVENELKRLLNQPKR